MRMRLTRFILALTLFPCLSVFADGTMCDERLDLGKIPDVRILKGDGLTAYRDPAVWYESGTFHLFFTLVETEADKSVFSYVAAVESCDLVHWTARLFTIRSRDLWHESHGGQSPIGPCS